jgi:hypothetical protein
MGARVLASGVTVLVVAMAGAAAADDARDARRAREAAEFREALTMIGGMLEAVLRADAPPPEADAPRKLKEALRTGAVRPDDWTAIAAWILHEKEEVVARGLSEALAEVDVAVAGREGERWNATTKALLGVFAGALREAEYGGRRGGGDPSPELERLMAVAAPALTDALREALAEADPVVRDAVTKALDGVRRDEKKADPRP